MTFDIDEYWSITVSHADRRAAKAWSTTARVYRRDSGKPIGDLFEGFGSTMRAAEIAAQRAAEAFVASQAIPPNWKPRK